MSYRLGNAEKYHIHNSPYFVSYEPKSYCPDAPSECVDYCMDPSNSAARAACVAGCPAEFDPDYFDRIISENPVGSDIRNKYCRLFYPKTQRMVNPTDSGRYLYFKMALPMYSSSNLANAFCYSDNGQYRPYDGPYSSGRLWNYYRCWRNKTGTSDGFGTSAGYLNEWFRTEFHPTDTDRAYDILNFGQRMAWTYTGRTWYQEGSPGDGYLHVPIGELYLNPSGSDSGPTRLELIEAKLDPKKNDETGYMSCNKSNRNECSYIINAGLTPAAGTLQTAIDHFLDPGESPFDVDCRKSYIVYVTDGLPSIDENGNPGPASVLIDDVLDKIDTLRGLVKDGVRHEVKTYVLGVGLNDEDKIYLDRMAVHGGTDVNGKAYYADAPEELRLSLQGIFMDILKKTASGTSVSILSERARKGSNVMQAVFYPEKEFGSDKVQWIGYLYTYWFHDSRSLSSLYEDSNGDRKLHLLLDHPISFDFSEGQLSVMRTDPVTGVSQQVSLDDVRAVWEAGDKLFRRSPDDRVIWTVGDGDVLVTFDEANLSSFSQWLGLPAGPHPFHSCLAESDDNATYANLVNYVRGKDLPGCRSRAVTIDSHRNTWKLGDIVYSTPKVAEDYRTCSNDSNKACTRDEDCGTGGTCQITDNLVFFGANDGMLHAVRAGYITKSSTGGNIVELNGENIGEEAWAFIPKNALPYLRQLARPDYGHLYYVDLTPYITTLGNKKVLIGGMRLGGNVCHEKKQGNNVWYECDAPRDTCSPSVLDESEAVWNPPGCVGLSSYFALDITDPDAPKLLWEFTHPNLGFSFSGPAIVRRQDGAGNWKYFVLFLSGPTDRDGGVEQNLHRFTLQLKDDLTIENVIVEDLETSFGQSFGGRLFTEGLDMDDDGQTDYVFFGFSKASGGDNWQGGIAKVYTGSSDPAGWAFDPNYFNGSQNPITAKVEHAKCFGHWYVFAGSGRYFVPHEQYSPSQSDVLFGFPFLCEPDGTCNPANINSVNSESDPCGHLQDWDKGNVKGWELELEKLDCTPEAGYCKERVITDPTVTDYNMVFFTTTEPTGETCGFGGRTRVWGLNCATGEPIQGNSCPGYQLSKTKGTLFLQTSTGALHQSGVPDAFDNGSGTPSRTTGWFAGTPPESATPFIPPAIKSGEVVLWMER
jgi:type IV pilus assembly protein PilY1